MNAAKKMRLKQISSRFLPYLLPVKGKLLWVTFGLFVMSSADAYMLPLLKKVADLGSITDQRSALFRIACEFSGVILVRGMVSVLSDYTIARIAGQIVYQLRCELYGHFISLPIHQFEQTTSGKTFSKLTYELEQIAEAITVAFTRTVKNGSHIFWVLGLLWYNSWRLSLILLVLAPCAVGLTLWIAKKFRQLNHGVQQLMGEMTHHVQGTIQGYQAIRLFSGEKREIAQFNGLCKAIQQKQLSAYAILSFSMPAMQYIVGLGVVVFLVVATLPSVALTLTPGSLQMLLLSLSSLVPSLKSLCGVNAILQKALAGCASVFEALPLDAPRLQPACLGSPLPFVLQRGIAFEGVTVQYPNCIEASLRSIWAFIPAQKTTMLVGRSGAGKSTMISVLLRAYEQKSGKVFLDQRDLADFSLDSLRKNIAVVSQHVHLFEDTIANNISYPSFDAAADCIERVAQAALVTEFTQGLPDGLQTHLGSAGIQLSGGQRQRIAIARALLRDPEIFIFDEATSALDSGSEAAIQVVLQSLRRQKKTVIIISHRLREVENADHIIVLENGAVAESGTHQTLMKNHQVYEAIYRQHHEQTISIAPEAPSPQRQDPWLKVSTP